MYFIFWCNRVFPTAHLSWPKFSSPSPELLCVIKIRILFLEICDSFSEIRRDLCSSYFYCKSNSLEKNVICTKALFLSQLRVMYCAELEGWGVGRGFCEP